MIRPLRPADIARYLLSSRLRHGNRAYTLDTVSNPHPSGFSAFEAARLAPWLRGNGGSWAFKQGAGAVALAAGTCRSGPQSWEVTHLLLDLDDGPDVVELLDKVAEEAAHCGAERLFLRLRPDDPLVYECRHAGFVPCLSETLYRGRGIRDGDSACDDVREKLAGEDYALFRLYNAATPTEVRSLYGMTFDQWRASRERYLGQTREYVLERDARHWSKVMP